MFLVRGTRWLMGSGCLAGVLLLQFAMPQVAGAEAAAPEAATLGTAEQVRDLPDRDASSKRRVSLQGVVTSHDPVWRLLFLQDSTGGVAVRVPAEGASLARGQTIAVEGSIASGGLAPVVDAVSLRVLTTATLPAPKPASITELLAGKYDCQRVELAGEITDMEAQAGRPRHGGRVWAEGRVGEGATFYFTLAGESAKKEL